MGFPASKFKTLKFGISIKTNPETNFVRYSDKVMNSPTKTRNNSSIFKKNHNINNSNDLKSSKSLKTSDIGENEELNIKKNENVNSKFNKLNSIVHKEIFGLDDNNISDFFQNIMNQRKKKVDYLNLKKNVNKINKLYMRFRSKFNNEVK